MRLLLAALFFVAHASTIALAVHESISGRVALTQAAEDIWQAAEGDVPEGCFDIVLVARREQP